MKGEKKMQTREFLDFETTFVDPTLYRKFIKNHISVIRKWACQTMIEGDIDWSTTIMKYVSDPTVSDADFYEITGNLALEIGTWCRSYVIAYVMCEENPGIDFVYAPPDNTGKEGVGYRYKAPWDYSDTEKALTWSKLVEILAAYAFELGIYSIDGLTFTYAKL